MTAQGWTLILVFTALTVAITKPMGAWLFRIMEGGRTWLHPVLGPVERSFYRIAGVDPDKDQSWKDYAVAMMLFSVAGIVLTYALQRLQYYLPLNPQGFA